MFRTTRGKIRGVLCASVLLTGVTASIGALLGNDDKEALASGIEPKVEVQAESTDKYYQSVNTKAHQMVEALVIEKSSSNSSDELTLVYNNEIFVVEFNYLDMNAVDVGDTVNVRYYEVERIMLED